MPPKAKQTYINNGLVFNKSDDSPVINKTTGLQRVAPKARAKKAPQKFVTKRAQQPRVKKAPKGMKKLPTTDLDAFARANPSRASEAGLDAMLAQMTATSELPHGFRTKATPANRKKVQDAKDEAYAAGVAAGVGLQPLPVKVRKARSPAQIAALQAAQAARVVAARNRSAARAAAPVRVKRVATPAQLAALAAGRAKRLGRAG